ncbi:MAG TPA: T9SS type A sorting domain-containing protein, partial [Chitinophagales bacterium]|nr:T9SS type A sorting domain-containing protein [Chitinophagales bacterium]
RMGLMNFPDKKQDGANAVGFNRLGPQIVPADNTEPGAWSMGFSNVTDGHEAFPCFEIPIKFDWRAHSCFNYRFYSDDCHNATWNFGDAQSGSTNTATGTDVTHTFSGVGIYPVTMVSNGQTSRDTIIITTPQVHIAGTPVLPCPQPFANYSLNTFQAHLKYQWTVTNGTPASALNTGDLNIQWLPGTTGTIKVVAIDAVYGCADSSVITVQIPDTLIATWPGGNDTMQTALQGIALTGGLPPGGVYSGEGVTNNIFYPDSIEGNSATLTYTYTDAYGCVATADRVFVVTGIDNLTLQKSLRIYPQPVNNRLTIECADCDFSNAETYLYDVTGKALITPVQKSHNHIQLQTSNLATGTYVLKLKLADEFAFIQFEKVY